MNRENNVIGKKVVEDTDEERITSFDSSSYFEDFSSNGLSFENHEVDINHSSSIIISESAVDNANETSIDSNKAGNSINKLLDAINFNTLSSFHNSEDLSTESSKRLKSSHSESFIKIDQDYSFIKSNISSNNNESSFNFNQNEPEIIDFTKNDNKNSFLEKEYGQDFEYDFNKPNFQSNFEVSGFTTASNKKIMVDKKKLDECRAIFDKELQVLDVKNFPLLSNSSNMEAQPTENESISIIDEKITNELKESSEENIKKFGQSLSEIEDDYFDPSEELIEKIQCESLDSQAYNSVEENKNTNKEEKGLELQAFSTQENIQYNKNLIYSPTIKKQNLPASVPMRKYNCPQTSHSTVKNRENLLIFHIFEKIKSHFKKEDKFWIFSQFKWTWLHFCLNPIKDTKILEEDIIKMMEIRRKNERSVLRRISEFDDVSIKYMVLGIIKYTEEYIELYDGYYSVKALINNSIYKYLKNKGAEIGSKLHVFGSKLLITSATSINDLDSPLLELYLNSIRLTNMNAKLGNTKAISFENKIAEIKKDGGVVACIKIEVKKVIESKFLVYVENYRQVVDDIEKEVEKIYELAEKAGRILKSEDFRIKHFVKMIVKDDSGECLLTWWDAKEVKENERYLFVYLMPAKDNIGLNLHTQKMTFIEKID